MMLYMVYSNCTFTLYMFLEAISFCTFYIVVRSIA